MSDTGEGMSEATRLRATEPFFSTKPLGEGVGLGLSMADGVVRVHQGTLTIRSRPGAGTTVTAHIPARPRAAIVAARDAGLQAIDGPYLLIKDLDGFREMAMRARALGYDGKWALHPGQIDVLNDVFTPTQEEYDKAEALLEAYKEATEVDRMGAVMFGNEMIDEASRKMAVQFAERGRAAGMKQQKRYADFKAEWN